jgi:methylated-DNA-[protein]-cysteine S-methyltransferase
VAQEENRAVAETLTLRLSSLPTPLGTLLFATDEQDRLRVLDWESHAERMHRLLARAYGRRVTLVHAPAKGPVADALRAYFDGDVTARDDVVTETAGTPFQREVWAALRKIPAGKTWSYAQLAAHIGRPAAVRAVGLANGANPVGLVAPCHRVIGANGSLTGYGGGLDRKQWLLEHERTAVQQAGNPRPSTSSG